MSTTFFTYCQVFSLDSVFLAGSAVHFPSFAPQILSDLSLFYKRNCLSCNCKLLVCRDHADLHFGITIDNEVNDATHGDEAVISTPDSKVKVCVIPTNEELAIARETVALVK